MVITDPKEEHVLEVGCRVVSHALREHTFSTSDVPRMRNVESMTALECLEEVQRYDEELKRFEEAVSRLAHEYKTEVHDEDLTTSEAEHLKRNYEEDIDLIRRGQAVLEKRRDVFAGKVRFAKLRRLLVSQTVKAAERINKEAEVALEEISVHQSALKAEVRRLDELQSQFNEVRGRFDSINLDAEKANSMTFDHKVPEKVMNFVRGESI